jgi:UDP-N-acetylglucosamine--N-acetylmuramyl-(pentapeptide) pyrophosphoryl-undecaprenol N-acetylglucosamine transferase
MRVWVAAGGTGGHLYPALAVAEELRTIDPGGVVWFAVSRRGLEVRVLEERGLKAVPLVAEGFHRRQLLRNLLFPVRTVAALLQSLRAVLRLRPQAAFGTGGFVSGPALLAAALLGIPFVLIALDTRPGVTIRLLAPRARRVFVTGGEAAAALGERRNIEIIGVPVRSDVRTDRTEARRAFGLPEEGTLLLVTGGSQGSRALNQAVERALTLILRLGDTSVLWQTGEKEAEELSRFAEAVIANTPTRDPRRVRVVPFIDRMDLAWSAADLAVCRAGASTVAELTVYGIPAILVPLATSAGGHQLQNARAMVTSGAAQLLPEEELNGTRLGLAIQALIEDVPKRTAMAAAASGMAHFGSARRVVEGLIGCARIEARERLELLERFRGGGI